MLGELGRLVVGGDKDIGEALVVAQQHVEARLQALDHVGFEKERLGLRLGAHEFHADRGRDHALDAQWQPSGRV